MRRTIFAMALLAALAGCSQQSDNSEALSAPEASPENQFGFRQATSGEEVVERVTTVDIEEPDAADSAIPGAAGGNAIPVSVPQIAYIYEFGFRIATGRMSALQERHVAMCENLGPQSCQVLEMNQSGGEGDYANGRLKMAVAADQARAFGAQLADAAISVDGEQVSSSIAGEDLSKQIVDTEARLRARSLLRDRLMEVLRSRQGTVAELVEAERGVAAVNEEIDQAQSWLAEMRGRVNFSRMNIYYESGARSRGGFIDPIRQAVGSVGTILGTVIAAIIVFFTIAIPVGLVVWTGLLVRRRVRKPATTPAEVELAEG